MLQVGDKSGSAAGRPPSGKLLERVGGWAIAQTVVWGAIAELIGEQVLRTAAWICRRAKIRAADALTLMRPAGIAALPILVALVNLMVGPRLRRGRAVASARRVRLGSQTSLVQDDSARGQFRCGSALTAVAQPRRLIILCQVRWSTALKEETLCYAA